MKKLTKALSITLAFIMVLSTMSTAALAAETDRTYLSISHELNVDGVENTLVEMPQNYTFYLQGERTEDGYFAMERNSTITVTNNAVTPGCFMFTLLTAYEYVDNSLQWVLNGVYGTDDTIFWTTDGNTWFDDAKQFGVGESASFTFPYDSFINELSTEWGVDTEGKEYMFILESRLVFPNEEWYWRYNVLKLDEASVAQMRAGQQNTAYASTQVVSIDGKAVTLEAYALKDASGNPTNYVKLRDVAYALNGTAAQFEVAWDGNVNIVTDKPYTANGSEMSTPFSGNRSYSVPTAVTKINGVAADLAAISLTDDNGGGYTYYQLRDLGRALGFNVGWSAERGIFIETNKPYTDAD